MNPITITLKDSNVPQIMQNLEMLEKDGSLQVTFSDLDKDRSNAQNRLSHLWYAYIAKFQTDVTEIDIKCHCKYTYGRGIIAKYHPDMVELFKMTIGHLSHEDKLKAMKLLPLTSILTVKQMVEYLTEMQRDYQTNGVVLPVPSDLYDMALMDQQIKR